MTVWRMRGTVMAGGALVLIAAGCSRLAPLVSTPMPPPPSDSVGPEAAAAVPVPSPRPPHREPVREAAHRAEPPAVPAEPVQVATLEPQSLVGLRPDAVKERIGPPEAIDKDGLALIWRYTADHCALNVYFFPDLKTSEFHVLKFSLAGADGKALDEDAPCRRKLLALKDAHAG